MAQYAYYNPAIPAPSPVIGWFDTGVLAYPNLPAPSDLLTMTPTEWEARLANPSGWAVSNGALVAYTPPPPVLTLAQQAATALSAGLAIISSGTPSINGTYAVDPASQSKMGLMYNLIQRAGGAAFPGGLTSLPWPVLVGGTGGVVMFNSVSEFLTVETILGDYVLALDLIVTTGAGSLPAASITIA